MKNGILVVAVCVCLAVSRADVKTNILAIHLLAQDQPIIQPIRSTDKAADFKINPKPILSDGDFILYEAQEGTDHYFTIAAEATKRLASELHRSMGSTTLTVLQSGEKGHLLSWSDTPFVLVASGNPIYIGFFSTITSSSAHVGMPVIQPAEKAFISTDYTNNVKFRITLTSQGTNQLGREKVTVPKDVLNDYRIIEAIRKLGINASK